MLHNAYHLTQTNERMWSETIEFILPLVEVACLSIRSNRNFTGQIRIIRAFDNLSSFMMLNHIPSSFFKFVTTLQVT